MSRILCLVFVFSVCAFWGAETAAAPQTDEYSFDEGKDESPPPVGSTVESTVESTAESTVKPTEVQKKAPSERSVPKLKADKPGRLMGAGTSAVGSLCCCLCPGLGAGVGAAAAYLISGAPINILRIAIVAGVTFVTGVVLSLASTGVSLASGTAGVVGSDPLNIITGGGSTIALGINLASLVIVPGVAAATWFFTEGIGESTSKASSAKLKSEMPVKPMAVAY